VEGSIPEAGGTGTVRVMRYDPLHVMLDVDVTAPAFLATAESYYPGWSARVDGIESTPVLTNGAFRGLRVPGGKHTITMEFAPPALWRGAALSAAAWLLWAFVWWPSRRRSL
jgi:uncharacterized membrane protein YfhO